jgi:hypothetical protein
MWKPWTSSASEGRVIRVASVSWPWRRRVAPAAAISPRRHRTSRSAAAPWGSWDHDRASPIGRAQSRCRSWLCGFPGVKLSARLVLPAASAVWKGSHRARTDRLDLPDSMSICEVGLAVSHGSAVKVGALPQSRGWVWDRVPPAREPCGSAQDLVFRCFVLRVVQCTRLVQFGEPGQPVDDVG